MTKPKNLTVIGEMPCESCNEPVPVQRCAGGKKVRVSCTACDIQKFMAMTTYVNKYGTQDDDPETGNQPEPATEPERGTETAREDTKPTYFF